MIVASEMVKNSMNFKPSPNNKLRNVQRKNTYSSLQTKDFTLMFQSRVIRQAYEKIFLSKKMVRQKLAM